MTVISSPLYRWRVGEAEITRVLEFEAALFEPAVLYPEVSLEVVRRHRGWLEPTLMDPASGLLVFAFHSTVVRNKVIKSRRKAPTQGRRTPPLSNSARRL